MRNESPLEPNEPTRAGPDQPTEPDFRPDVVFWNETRGTWKERSFPESKLLLVLSNTPALLTWRDEHAEAIRTPIAQDKAWFIPAHTSFAAHWHGPASIVCLGQAALGFEFKRPRIFRLIDLARTDWDLSQIISAQRAGDPGPEKWAVRLAQRVAAILQDNEVHWRTTGLSSDRLRVTLDFIEENLAQKLTREQLAELGGQSLHHFVRLFKARMGLSIREYITLRRCFRARELIQLGERQADAASAVGFSDQQKMCNKFTQIFGSPPSTFAPADPE